MGGEAGKESEYDGIFQRWEDSSSEIVPLRAWNRLKHAIDSAGLRMEFQAAYRAENEALRENYGLPLQGRNVVAGYEREIVLFKCWHLRVHGSPPTRWPWESEVTP